MSGNKYWKKLFIISSTNKHFQVPSSLRGNQTGPGGGRELCSERRSEEEQTEELKSAGSEARRGVKQRPPPLWSFGSVHFEGKHRQDAWAQAGPSSSSSSSSGFWVLLGSAGSCWVLLGPVGSRCAPLGPAAPPRLFLRVLLFSDSQDVSA